MTEKEQREKFERDLGYTEEEVHKMAVELDELKKAIGLCIAGGFLDEKKLKEAQDFVSTFYAKQ
jgi:hypothetical protein